MKGNDAQQSDLWFFKLRSRTIENGSRCSVQPAAEPDPPNPVVSEQGEMERKEAEEGGKKGGQLLPMFTFNCDIKYKNDKKCQFSVPATMHARSPEFLNLQLQDRGSSGSHVGHLRISHSEEFRLRKNPVSCVEFFLFIGTWVTLSAVVYVLVLFSELKVLSC